jgi:hypothetical protein
MRAHRRSAESFLDLEAVGNTQILLMSTTLTDLDGVGVQMWPDIAGGFDATQATAGRRPIMRRTGANITPNSSPSVEFDGNDDWLANATLPGAGVISTNAGLMVYAYFKQISLTNSSAFDLQQLFDCGTSNGVLELVADSSVDVGVGWPDDEVGMNTSTVRRLFGAAVTGWQLLTFEFIGPPAAGASIKVYRNNVQIGTTQTNWQFTDIRAGYGFGNTIGINTGWRGAMAHLQVVNTQHDAATRTQIYNSILNTYG